MKLLKEEQETIIRFDRTRTLVDVFTADPVMQRKLERGGIAPVRTYRSGRFYQVSYRRLRWGIRREKPT